MIEGVCAWCGDAADCIAAPACESCSACCKNKEHMLPVIKDDVEAWARYCFGKAAEA